MIRTLAGNGTQECVGFSLDVDDPLSLFQALRQGINILAQAGVLNALRIRLTPALGFQRCAGSALLAPPSDMRRIDAFATTERRSIEDARAYSSRMRAFSAAENRRRVALAWTSGPEETGFGCMRETFHALSN